MILTKINRALTIVGKGRIETSVKLTAQYVYSLSVVKNDRPITDGFQACRLGVSKQYILVECYSTKT